ncbi:hypothetical protein KFK09_005216 [Dendrobium nobile]|uniref:Uncharacterized protein n=1 Tax=Dendrobium nobile TaxID=94219 RepID=A0A8T3BXU4_DENNO|nr:hypothetical protein KFK09_005216 [Dendrobium nobile]
MSRAVSQSRRVGVVDRFNGAARVRRTQRYVPRAAPVSLSSTISEPHGKAEETAGESATEAFGRQTTNPSNLERFMEATTPSVPAHYLSKKHRDWRTCDEECRTYFKLEDLWESFKEWSAYGLGVPLMLNGKDSVVQYYVPYLSGIQLYADSSTQSLGPRNSAGGGDADSFRDISIDGSSDSEMESESKYSGNRSKNCISRHYMIGMNKPSSDGKHRNLRNEFSSDDSSDCGDSQGALIFEYLENDRPYFREPLVDKIVDLAKQFPVLKTIRSCDLLPESWFSVAWYPIYRIPVGPTLTDLDACFLTFHFLSTPMKGTARRPIITKQKISLPVFGLASLKCHSSLWTSNGESDGKLAHTLFQAADKWLRLLKTNLPDYSFFVSRY